MASTTTAGKRPHQLDGEDSGTKRVRSNNGSPAPPPAAQNGETAEQRKRRETQERLAAVKARLAASKPGTPGSSSTPPVLSAPPTATPSSDIEASKAAAQKKIAEVKARLAAARQAAGAASPANGTVATPPQQPTGPVTSDREARLAEVRARAAKLAQQREITSIPVAPPPRQEGRVARGGLATTLHPALTGDLPTPASTRGKPQGPKFSTTKGNEQPAHTKSNPYLSAPDEESKDADANAGYDATIATRKGGARKSKQLVFNERGKFVAQANALRQQARLEDMKRRIALETRKVQIEEASDRSFLVPPPPDVEWWDEGLLPEGQRSYEDCLKDGRNRIETEGTIITTLIQRPVLLAPPQDKFIPPPKPLMLTTTEQKKLRRQRRMVDMKEEQAKIRLGLVEPPPPKVKKSNMMRVLGEQAVKDPTAVEVRVNREIAQRQENHERANEERKLTKEQRAEKIKRQQAGDEARGFKIAVFKVDNLSSGKHRYQIDVNAKQNALTGIVLLHPTMNLIIVEGGVHSITNYKKLMLNRIKWTENALPLSSSNPTTFTQQTNPATSEAGTNKAAQWCNPIDEQTGQLKDLSENRCVLVWEGDEQTRLFRRWGSKVAETDGEARDILGRQKLESMWGLAKSKQ